MRWRLQVSSAAEAGGDAGSDFVIGYYSDAGVLKNGALSISRATGDASFSGTVVTAQPNSTKAGLRLPPGGTPTNPVNGDLWMLSDGLYGRINGVTVKFSSTPAVAMTVPGMSAEEEANANIIWIDEGPEIPADPAEAVSE